MGGDMEYVKNVQEAVDLLARRKTREGGGFVGQWCLHLEVTIGLAHITLSIGCKHKDIPALMRKYYGEMAGMVLKQISDKTCTSGESVRKYVSASMLHRGPKVKNLVTLQAWRDAAAAGRRRRKTGCSYRRRRSPLSPSGGAPTWKRVSR